MTENRLIEIGQNNKKALLDVVFVHGITGGPFTTWNGISDDCEKADLSCMGQDYWPENLKNALNAKIGEQAPNVWTLGYPAPLLALNDPLKYPESIIYAARPSLGTLVNNQIGAGDRAIVFVTHSLGGLIVKAILANSEKSDDSREKRILTSTRGVAFLATPHSGSGLATLLGNVPALLKSIGTTAKAISWLQGIPVLGSVSNSVSAFAAWLTQSSNQTQWLERAGADLRLLAETYRTVALRHAISTRAYYETQPFRHLFPKDLLWVVDAANADPDIPGCRPVPAPGCDHIEICKPCKGRTEIADDIQHWVVELLQWRRRGTYDPVLDEEIKKIRKAIVRRRPIPFKDLPDPLPRTLEEIPSQNDLRKEFSHAFKSEAASLLRKNLADELSSNSQLRETLENSEWDLDQLMLFLWRGQQLETELKNYLKLLEDRSSWIQGGGSESPSLILTYRLIDSLRDALRYGFLPLASRIKDTRDWIEKEAEPDRRLDGGGETRRLLDLAHAALTHGANWETPKC